MFNSIKGIVSGKTAEALYLDNGGIEWEIFSSAFSLGDTPSVGSSVKLYLHLYHREDTIQLFGFRSREERQLFRSLISVSGLGPRGAIKILSGIQPVAFKALLGQKDIVGLARLPGVGKKTAQKILLHLQGEFVREPTEALSLREEEIVESLTVMGFDRAKARAVVSQGDHPSSSESEEEGEVLRRAIIELSRGEKTESGG